MKHSKFAIIGMVLGLIYMFASAWWFWQEHPDIDKLITNLLIGASVFGIWFNYNRMLIHLNHDHERLEQKINYIDDMMEEIITK